jgi:hypothetical protein
MKQLVFIAMLCTFVSSPVFAKSIEKYGIKAVPEIYKDKLMECEYLGDVESKSLWGGVLSSNLGKKGVEKRLYKKANEMGATHIMIAGTGIDYSGYTKGSAQAFDCNKVTQNEESESPSHTSSSYLDEIKALATLRDDGIITEDEFQKQKADILARH